MRIQYQTILTIYLYLFVMVESKMTLIDIESQKMYNITVYNGLPWDTAKIIDNTLSYSNTNVTKLPIFRIDQPQGQFNPCIESTMTPEFIEHYLQNSFMKNEEFNRENGWLALVHGDDTIISSCGGVIPTHMIYATYVTRVAQYVGAKGLLWLLSRTNGEGSGIAAADVLALAPNIDIQNRIVKGTKINIPAFAAETIQKINNELLDISKLDRKWAVSLMPLHQPKTDWSPYNDLVATFGAYRIIWWVIGVFSLLLAPFIFKHCIDVRLFYKEKNDEVSQVAFRMRMLILIPELLNTLVRVLVAMDPFGAFYIFDFVQARVFFNLSNSLSTFTDIAMIIYSWDIYNVFKSSRNFERVEPFMLRHKMGGILVLSFAFLMMLVDIVVLLLGLFGHLGVDAILMPVLYMILANSVVVGILLKISSMMKREVQSVLSSLQKNNQLALKNQKDSSNKNKVGVSSTRFLYEGAPNKKFINSGYNSNKTRTKTTTVPTGKNATMGPLLNNMDKQSKYIEMKTRSFLKMRRYMILAACGRLASIVSFALVGSNWYFYSVFNFGFSLALLGVASTFSSFFQILAAVQLSSSQVKKNAAVIAPVDLKKITAGGAENKVNDHRIAKTASTPIASKKTVNQSIDTKS